MHDKQRFCLCPTLPQPLCGSLQAVRCTKCNASKAGNPLPLRGPKCVRLHFVQRGGALCFRQRSRRTKAGDAVQRNGLNSVFIILSILLNPFSVFSFTFHKLSFIFSLSYLTTLQTPSFIFFKKIEFLSKKYKKYL
jgi:hypothetical protein